MPIMAAPSQGQDFEVIDEGFYAFELTGIREPRTEDNPFKPGSTRTSVALEWTCRDDDDFDGVMVLNFYTLSLGTADYPSKLRPFVAALIGRAITDDDEEGFDLEELIGGRLRATVRHYERKAGGVRAVLESPIAIKKSGRGKPKAEAGSAEDNPFADEEVA